MDIVNIDLKFPLNREFIETILFQRGDELLISKVLMLEKKDEKFILKSRYQVPEHPSWEKTHRPNDRPTMPGTTILHSGCQAAAILVHITQKNGILLFTGCDNVDIGLPVYPGETIDIKVYKMEISKKFGQTFGQAQVLITKEITIPSKGDKPAKKISKKVLSGIVKGIFIKT